MCRSKPKDLQMSGLPFMLQGWNSNQFIFNPNDNSYHLEGYILYGIIDIIGVTIKKIDGVWTLIRDWDWCGSGIHKIGPNQDSPFGKWTYGATVRNCQL